MGNPLLFPVSRSVQEHAPYLDSVRFTNMCASSRALFVRDLHSVLAILKLDCESGVGCYYVDRGMSVSRSVSSEVYYTFILCYEEFECEKDLWALVLRYDRQQLPEPVPFFMIFYRSFSHVYVADCLDC